MRSILDKMVRGMTEVGDKAKVIVEVGNIKAQIYQLEHEIEKIYSDIGRTAFGLAVSCEDTSINSPKNDTSVLLVSAKLHEIETLSDKIMELNGEKKCSKCSKSIAIATKYCHECGQENQVPDITEPETFEDVKICNNCGIQLIQSAKFCGDCGKATSEAE